MWNESSLNRLYNNAVQAFPHTKKRQYATDTVAVTQLEWMPYIGMRTLFLKGHVNNSDGGEYDPMILFKNVKYHSNIKKGLVEIISSDTNQKYFLEILNGNKNDVLLRCECKDYFWRFNYYNNLEKSNYSQVRKPYDGSYRVNPKEMSGMCKHLMALGIKLQEAGIVNGLQFRR